MMSNRNNNKEMKKVFNDVLIEAKGRSITLRSVKLRMEKLNYRTDVIGEFILHLKESPDYKRNKRGNDYVLKDYVNNTGKPKVVIDEILTPTPRRSKKVKEESKHGKIDIKLSIPETVRNISKTPTLSRPDMTTEVENAVKTVECTLPGMDFLNKEEKSIEVTIFDKGLLGGRIPSESPKDRAKRNLEEKKRALNERLDREKIANGLIGDHISCNLDCELGDSCSQI